jgi:hypothetical protein
MSDSGPSGAGGVACVDRADDVAGNGDLKPRGPGQRPPGTPPVFRLLPVNTLVTGVTSTFLWFALTFWVYLVLAARAGEVALLGGRPAARHRAVDVRHAARAGEPT